MVLTYNDLIPGTTHVVGTERSTATTNNLSGAGTVRTSHMITHLEVVLAFSLHTICLQLKLQLLQGNIFLSQVFMILCHKFNN